MPLNKLPWLGSSFDLVLADPPFLSDECLTKTAVTLKFLAKDKILLCTGNFDLYFTNYPETFLRFLFC